MTSFHVFLTAGNLSWVSILGQRHSMLVMLRWLSANVFCVACLCADDAGLFCCYEKKYPYAPFCVCERGSRWHFRKLESVGRERKFPLSPSHGHFSIVCPKPMFVQCMSTSSFSIKLVHHNHRWLLAERELWVGGGGQMLFFAIFFTIAWCFALRATERTIKIPRNDSYVEDEVDFLRRLLCNADV